MSCQVVTRQNALKVDKFGRYFEPWVAQKIKIKNLKKTSSIHNDVKREKNSGLRS